MQNDLDQHHLIVVAVSIVHIIIVAIVDVITNVTVSVILAVVIAMILMISIVSNVFFIALTLTVQTNMHPDLGVNSLLVIPYFNIHDT